MAKTTEPSIYEKAFAKSYKTDAVLIVDGKKLHVNKALLSYHSEYFKKAFDKKSMAELEIKGVYFEDLAQCLSLVQDVPIKINEYRLKSLISFADRFQLLAAKYHLELIIMTTGRKRESLLKFADEYKLDMVMGRVLSGFKCKSEFLSNTNEPLEYIKNLSAETRDKVFKRALAIDENIKKPTNYTPLFQIYHSTFAESDKTDAILVVQERELHVNQALLSYHSDYFNKMFYKGSKIRIQDAGFEEFATLLSMLQIQPISPTISNAEHILKLADRFRIRVAKRHIELFLLASGMHNLEKIQIAEKYGMDDLLEFGIQNLTKENFNSLPERPIYKRFSSETKNKLFYRYLRI